MRILIIDDEVDVAGLLARAVEEQGHETTLVYDGETALSRLKDLRPDAVFLDVRLPGLSGIEVLRKIRAVDPDLPVILITGHALTQELEEARRLNVTDIVEKLYVLSHLTEALGRFNAGPRDRSADDPS